MRLNGTYLDRLIIKIIPITVIASVLLYFSKQTTLKSIVLAGIILTLFLWILDSFIIYRRHPISMKLTDELFFDNILISPSDIEDIRQITCKPGRFWTWEYFEFSIRIGNDLKIFNVIEKPQTLIETWLGKESRTLTPLFTRFPDVKKKFTHHTTLHSFR